MQQQQLQGSQAGTPSSFAYAVAAGGTDAAAAWQYMTAPAWATQAHTIASTCQEFNPLSLPQNPMTRAERRQTNAYREREAARKRMVRLRAQRTPELAAHLREAERLRVARYRANQSPEEKERRCAAQRARMARKRAAEKAVLLDFQSAAKTDLDANGGDSEAEGTETSPLSTDYAQQPPTCVDETDTVTTVHHGGETVHIRELMAEYCASRIAEQGEEERQRATERIAHERAEVTAEGAGWQHGTSTSSSHERTMRMATCRANMTAAALECRRETDRLRVARYRAEQGAEEVERRRTYQRERMARIRAQATAEEVQRRRVANREYMKRKRAERRAPKAEQSCTAKREEHRAEAEETAEVTEQRHATLTQPEVCTRSNGRRPAEEQADRLQQTGSERDEQSLSDQLPCAPVPVIEVFGDECDPTHVKVQAKSVLGDSLSPSSSYTCAPVRGRRSCSQSRLSRAIKDVRLDCPAAAAGSLQRRNWDLARQTVTCLLPESHDMALARRAPVDKGKLQRCNSQLLHMRRLRDIVPTDGVSETSVPTEQLAFAGPLSPSVGSGLMVQQSLSLASKQRAGVTNLESKTIASPSASSSSVRETQPARVPVGATFNPRAGTISPIRTFASPSVSSSSVRGTMPAVATVNPRAGTTGPTWTFASPSGSSSSVRGTQQATMTAGATFNHRAGITGPNRSRSPAPAAASNATRTQPPPPLIVVSSGSESTDDMANTVTRANSTQAARSTGHAAIATARRRSEYASGRGTAASPGEIAAPAFHHRGHYPDAPTQEGVATPAWQSLRTAENCQRPGQLQRIAEQQVEIDVSDGEALREPIACVGEAYMPDAMENDRYGAQDVEDSTEFPDYTTERGDVGRASRRRCRPNYYSAPIPYS